MPDQRRSLIWTIRFASALGFLALTLTGEISGIYMLFGWGAWAASFFLDTVPAWGHRQRKWETAAVGLLVSVFLMDFFYWDLSIFVCVAHFLMVFQMFKMLGLKERKDCLQILIFSFFQMLSACTLSVDVWQAIILLLLIPTGTAGLFWQQINLEAEESHQPLPGYAARPYRRWITGLCLAAIPVNILFAAVVFTLFPRLAFRGAFSGLGAERSGYNEQVNLSQTNGVGEDNSSVLWLRIMPMEDRARWKGYLRGGTLDFFDGKKWSRSPRVVSQTMYADSNGVFKIRQGKHGLRQDITLVNTAGATLFGSPIIGEAVAPLATLQTMGDGSVRWASGWRKPLRYEVISFDQPDVQVRSKTSPDYLQLAPISLDRTRALIRQIAPQKDPLAKARAIESYLRSHYGYSLQPGAATPENPVENFLFVRKQGPCGYFASAMAVMLRLEGIPSRIVAGYYKGSWNERLQQYLIRERDAHAWVEANIPGQGWITFDPTPRAVTAPGTQRWLLRVQENWEYLNYQWDRLVIEYDLYSQVKAVQDIQSNTNRMNAVISGWIDRHLMGKRSSSEIRTSNSKWRLSGLNLKMAGTGALVILGIGIFWAFRKQSLSQDPAIAFYQKFLDQMTRKGFPKTPSETGLEYAERLSRTADSESAWEITQQYYRTRFR